MGVGLVAGSYLALAKVIPLVFGANDTTYTWTLEENNPSATYTFDSNLVTVDENGAHPTGGVGGGANKFTNPSFDSNNSSWSSEVIIPTGWIKVPGNAATYGTSDFLVMQYEAKYDCTGDGVGDLAATCNAAAPTGAGLDWVDIDQNTSKIVSTPEGAPIVNITQLEAATACPYGSRLIRNNEWMTLVRNIELVSSNWANGVIGSMVPSGGGLKKGNAGALDSAGYNGADPEQGTGRDSKASFVLSNQSVIWDISGNAAEWVRTDAAGTLISKQDNPETTTNGVDVVTDTNFGWTGFVTTGTGSRYSFNDGTEPPLGYNAMRPTQANYGPNHGTGNLLNFSNSTDDVKQYAMVRGGHWSTTTKTGAFALYMDNTATSRSGYISYRCVYEPTVVHTWTDNGRATGADTYQVSAFSDLKVYQSVNVGDTNSYNFSAWVYNEGAPLEPVDESVVSLYYNGAAIATTYTLDAESGWWKLSATITGANASRDYGVIIKANHTLRVDDFLLYKSGTYSIYTTSAYSNEGVSSWDSFCEGTFTGDVCTSDATYSGDSIIKYQICTDDGASCESGNGWKYWNETAWTSATDTTTTVNTAASITTAAMRALPIDTGKISVKAIFVFGASGVPLLPNISIGLTTDTDEPDVNASDIVMKRTSSSSVSLNAEQWTNKDNPYFTWDVGHDVGGSGLKGYCLYLGHDSSAVPNQEGVAPGIPNGTFLGTSPVPTDDTECAFIVGTNEINFSTDNLSYRGASWLETNASNNPYYLKVWAIDNAGNIRTSDPATFTFNFDDSLPTNVAYISPASGSFSNVIDMSFSWPTSGDVSSSDDNSTVLGWQYQINSTDSDKWKGTATHEELGIRYIPANQSNYHLTVEQDAYEYDNEGNPTTQIIKSGNNVVYFRTVDAAGNYSSDSTVRTGNLQFGGAAPYFGGTDHVTVNPTTTDTNSFALSWPEATPTSGQHVAHYYYMVRTTPPTSLETLQNNEATYIDNGTSRTVTARALPNVNQGENTVYVVAVDDAENPNYSPSNVITGTFTLNSTNPDNVGNLVASDSSIKAQERWNVALTWTEPVYKGAGNLDYWVYRSTDGENFTHVGTTSGLSYVDNTPESTRYYYKVYTKDGTDASSTGSNAVVITPTGKWESAPELNEGPSVSNISTKKASVEWSTSRGADSKVQYGTKSGHYYSTEPSKSSQVTSHAIELGGLNPSTTYFYKVRWTDEDGNTGTSEEKIFTTKSAPSIKDVIEKNVGLGSALIQYTTKGASKVKIYYGKTTSFGGVKEVNTSDEESQYLTEISGLEDGTKYYYKINSFDNESNEYDGTILDFTTLPRPVISAVRIQQVANTAQSTILVSWKTNTGISSIIEYYPVGKPKEAMQVIDTELVKGEHKAVIRSLQAKKEYSLVVKGRDKAGNEAISDVQRFTTATDTREPKITNLFVEGSTSRQQKDTVQIIVSWSTDEPATSQVEYAEGTGAAYSYSTQVDENLTFNHIVLISDLEPSKVYHLRAISKDDAGNKTTSSDTVTITPKGQESALNLVIFNLQEVFGFIENFRD